MKNVIKVRNQQASQWKLATVLLLAIFGQLILSWTVVAGEPTYFRYKNDKGATVVTTVLPPEIVERGYQIVTARGDVLREIPAALPLEERIAQQKEQRSQLEQEKYDERLLLKYSSLAEVRRARDRKLSEMEGKITVLTGNLNNIKTSIEGEQFKAANYERAGKPVPEVLLLSLEDLYENLDRTESLIADRTLEFEETKRRFKGEYERYKELKGLK